MSEALHLAFSEARSVHSRSPPRVSVQGVDKAKTRRERASGRWGPARSFRFLGAGLRDSLPKTRGHFENAPLNSYRHGAAPPDTDWIGCRGQNT